jgi:hypothetical protein
MKVRGNSLDEEFVNVEKEVLHSKIESFMDKVDDVKKEKDHDYICKIITGHFS